MLAIREKYLPLQRVHYSILQKPSTMKLGHMTAIISTALAMTLSAYAQGELPDSIRTPRVPITMPTDTIDHTPAATVLPSQFEASSNAAYDRRAPIDRQLPPVNSAAYTYRAYPFTSGIAPIYTWDTGSIYASGASTSKREHSTSAKTSERYRCTSTAAHPNTDTSADWTPDGTSAAMSPTASTINGALRPSADTPPQVDYPGRH